MKNKKNYIVEHPIISLLVLLSVCSMMVVLSMVIAAQSKENERKFKNNNKQNEIEEVSSLPIDQNIIGVIKNINLLDKEITLIEVKTGEEHEFTYFGGTDIRDKFDQIISMSQLGIGEIVEAGYQDKNKKLMKLYAAKEAWEYQKLDDLMIDKSNKTLHIGSMTYEYDKDLMVLYKGELSQLYEIHEMDEVTVRGYDTLACSISVTKGHGTIVLIEDEEFIGGTINVGTAVYDTIKEDMVITVREGNYNLTVENGKYSGTKNINVFADKETEVSVGDFGPEAVKKGRVKFEINPFGADLIIDGELMSYKLPIELPYGEHDIEVSLGGYTTYEGTLVVDTSSKQIRIDLIEKTATNLEGEGNQTSQDDVTENWEVDDPFDDTEDEDDNSSGNKKPDQVLDGYEDNSEEDYQVDEDHFIYIQNPEGASVYLNGVYQITSPGSFEKVIGTHYITFIKEGYETKSYTIEVEDDGLDAYFNFPDMGKSAE